MVGACYPGANYFVVLSGSRMAHRLPSVPGNMPNLRVLIADDNRDAADTLAVLCRLWGHTVCVAYDGPTALDLADKSEPHVILLDIRMPGMHGGEVAERMRRSPLLRQSLIY